mgnify:CR=1 FL=1
MPAVTQRQENFMRLVHAVQKGALKKSQVGTHVWKAAREMKQSSVKDFMKGRGF